MLQPADWNAAAQACHEDGFLILIWKSWKLVHSQIHGGERNHSDRFEIAQPEKKNMYQYIPGLLTTLLIWIRTDLSNRSSSCLYARHNIFAAAGRDPEKQLHLDLSRSFNYISICPSWPSEVVKSNLITSDLIYSELFVFLSQVLKWSDQHFNFVRSNFRSAWKTTKISSQVNTVKKNPIAVRALCHLPYAPLAYQPLINKNKKDLLAPNGMVPENA